MMFKSSKNLRLAAEMRALERVARPWREARTSWFDGTPESVEARLAATDRVLTYAKAGVTPAHMTLEREAATARAELREASHRLLIDPLDDSARAFKGSKRVAKERGLRECINCEGSLSGEEGDDKDAECGTCGMSAHEKGVDWRKSSRTASDEYPLGPGYERPGFGHDDIAEHDDYLDRHDYRVPEEFAWMQDAVRNYPGPNPYAREDTREDRDPFEDDPDPYRRGSHNHPFDRARPAGRTAAETGGLDWKYVGGGEDDGQSGHEATTELGDLIQTDVERPTIPNPNGRGGTIDFESPPLGWGYGIWTYEPFENEDGERGNHRHNGGDGDHVWQGNNGKTIYKTHDEAKRAAEDHYYSLDHRNRNAPEPGLNDSGVDYEDLMNPRPDLDDDFGDIFGGR